MSQGVFLNLQASEERNPNWQEEHDLTCLFRGDIIICTRRADERAESESNSMTEIMAKAPLEMTLKNAVVRIEIVAEQDGESTGER